MEKSRVSILINQIGDLRFLSSLNYPLFFKKFILYVFNKTEINNKNIKIENLSLYMHANRHLKKRPEESIQIIHSLLSLFPGINQTTIICVPLFIGFAQEKLHWMRRKQPIC